ncbi:MAG TPA: type II toxin-antitoxin system RelE/ParE family toxin [Brevundimonas sp.]|uniref:type II toxin-antitoxin system RelE/ParE family toxin n=1 Tax=Brevundimonas sp. TaxID=1871086 RepID=UPI002E119868|nr:type II toxin-antitoxin system RelE/ParE family toxin [Brevundimonas sp.]
MKTIIWSPQALAQHDSALDYLGERNLPAAERLAERVRVTVEQLARRPTGRPGRTPGSFEKIVPGTRYLLVFDIVGDELHVLRLFHMSQDWWSWSNGADE